MGDFNVQEMNRRSEPPARYRSLDLWRGVACLSVIVYHAALYSTPALRSVTRFGEAGVWIFFVISGYCISAAAEQAGRSGLPVRVYFWRRLRRIFPPYWVALAATVLGLLALALSGGAWLLTESATGGAMNVISDPRSLTARQWLGTVTLTEMWRPIISGDTGRWLMGHAWTLGYEEQFYAVVGFVLWVAPKRIATGLAGVTAFVVVCILTSPLHHIPGGFFFDGQWFLFAFGAMVYYGRADSARDWPLLIIASTLIAAWLMPWARGPVGAAGTFALIALLLYPHDHRLVGSRLATPLFQCGVRCYSVYLVHWPVTKLVSHVCALGGVTGTVETVLLTIPLCITASLAVAWPFHKYIERPFLNRPISVTMARSTLSAPKPALEYASVPSRALGKD
jgi:peptidoglycan/LPS O-acetylase OafA/YrhL